MNAGAPVERGVRSVLQAAIDGMADCAAAAHRYQALRRRRTAARRWGLTAALRPSVGHPCGSTAR